MSSASELRAVHLLQVPLDLHARAVQWHEDLMREFTLISLSDSGEAETSDDGATVPTRLLTLVTELERKYAAFTDSTTRELEDARRRGEKTADVTYTVPADMADQALRFDELLDEADEFCRSGELLTVAAPPDLAAFRRWLLGEFTRQLRGETPIPWSSFRGASSPPGVA